MYIQCIHIHTYSIHIPAPGTANFRGDGRMGHLTRDRNERVHATEADRNLEQLRIRYDVLGQLEVACEETDHRPATWKKKLDVCINACIFIRMYLCMYACMIFQYA